jgi:hypothetical protein
MLSIGKLALGQQSYYEKQVRYARRTAPFGFQIRASSGRSPQRSKTP